MFFDEQILDIPRSVRWQIYHRLQDLMINCSCPQDGSLRVQVNTLQEAMLVHSTVMQFLSPRSELVSWLEVCWDQSIK
ncbi:MAG: hypothetical protein F6K62_06035 [Sphaerospermopsis sp. SIO1G2]|nr:hypothetical protein [Sphaerospermopsis sp. SIO1G1]NET70545.1 hypothetical protein [Sphaerospermopsis sp. SIO1G2]